MASLSLQTPPLKDNTSQHRQKHHYARDPLPRAAQTNLCDPAPASRFPLLSTSINNNTITTNHHRHNITQSRWLPPPTLQSLSPAPLMLLARSRSGKTLPSSKPESPLMPPPDFKRS